MVCNRMRYWTMMKNGFNGFYFLIYVYGSQLFIQVLQISNPCQSSPQQPIRCSCWRGRLQAGQTALGHWAHGLGEIDEVLDGTSPRAIWLPKPCRFYSGVGQFMSYLWYDNMKDQFFRGVEFGPNLKAHGGNLPVTHKNLSWGGAGHVRVQ